jgi:iron complex transport system substrate-binding protein
MHSARSSRLVILIAAIFALLASSTAAAAQRRAGDYPVTVHSADGSVTVPARPTRILSLSPSATQMLYAIGAGHQVVGVDKYSTYPPGAPRTSLTGGETNAQAYLPFHPDLVVLAFSTGTVIAQLHALHIPTLLLPPATTFANVDAQIAELGAATGHIHHAALVVRSLGSDLQRAARGVQAAVAGKSYYVELDPTLYSATAHTFIGAVFSLFHMRDIADPGAKAGPYPQLSPEYLLTSNPDYVVLADTMCCGQSPSTFAKRPGFAALSAVKDHHVLTVPDSLASQWGPHSLETLVALLAHDFHHRHAAARRLR